MAKSERELTRLEWALMDGLWDVGRGTAADLQQAMAERQGWAYSTVKTMLDRLVGLGYVRARRVGNVYEYTPKKKRTTVVARVVDDVTERMFQGSVAPFIQCLLARGDLTEGEIDELREMLDQHEDAGKGES